MKTVAIASVLALAVVGGCGGSSYNPGVPDTQLASYAANAKYPSGQTADVDNGPGLFYTVNDYGVITIYNAGTMDRSGFDVWVNEQYVINYTKSLKAHSSDTLVPEHVYNRNGQSLQSIKPGEISKVQIATQGHVYTLLGPVKPM